MSKIRYFTITGNMLGALTLVVMVTLVHFVFPSHKVEIAAMILAIVATVYPAIMLAQNVPLKDALTEGAAAAVTLLFALLGLVFVPALIAAGLLFHAVWDWIKHRTGAGVKVVAWYPPMCAIVDTISALYIFWVISL